MSQVQALPTERHATCLLEFIYFSRPDTMLYNRSLHYARRRMGHELAKEHPAPGAHVVIPVPDTSRPSALQLATRLGLTYRDGFESGYEQGYREIRGYGANRGLAVPRR